MRHSTRVLSLALAGLLVGVSTAVAQQTTSPAATELGVKGGLTVANLKGASVGHSGDRLGLTLGGYVGRRLTSNIGLQAEVLFNQRGAEFESGESQGAFRVNYIDVPVVLQVGTRSRWDTFVFAFAGPTFSRKLSASLTEDGADVPGFSAGNIESSDVGFTVGLGAQGHRLSMDARYTFGSRAVEQGTAKITNRSFSVMAGIRVW